MPEFKTIHKIHKHNLNGGRAKMFHSSKLDPKVYGYVRCPKCKVGYPIVRSGRYGAFEACSEYPRCRFSRSIK